MFWILILAHLLGDFPLQFSWMIREKHKFWVLSLHASIHFLLMLLLVGETRQLIWPYLLILSLVHMLQDKLKLYLTNRFPKKEVSLFNIDQIFHILTIYFLASIIRISDSSKFFIEQPRWVFIFISYLSVTYVWFIVEKVFFHSDHGYQNNIEQTKLTRMLMRGGLVSLFFLVQNSPLNLIAGIFFQPYPPSKYRRRAILTDIGVSIFVIIFMALTIKK